METFKIRTGEVSLRCNGLIQFDILFSGELTSSDMSELFFVKSKLCSRKCPLLIRYLTPHTLSASAQNDINGRSDFSAIGVYVPTSIQFQMESYLNSILETNFPIQVFTEENIALSWLQNYI